MKSLLEQYRIGRGLDSSGLVGGLVGIGRGQGLVGVKTPLEGIEWWGCRGGLMVDPSVRRLRVRLHVG